MRSTRLLQTTTGCIAVAALLFAGCSDEQKRDIEGAAATVAMEDEGEDQLDDAGYELDGNLDCEVDIRDDATVVGSCTGTTEAGDDVVADLTGTVNIDFEDPTCTSSLTVSVAAERVANEPNFDCFDD